MLESITNAINQKESRIAEGRFTGGDSGSVEDDR